MANHIENLLDREPGLGEGDRRKMRVRLAELRRPITTEADERLVAGILSAIQHVASCAFELSKSVIQAIATPYIRQELKLPQGAEKESKSGCKGRYGR
jgi:hypothetical protein